MKQITLALLAVAFLTACHTGSTPTPTPPVTASTTLSRMMPGIDTATLWNIVLGNQRSGGTAHITATGDLTITGFTTPAYGGNPAITYAGGSFKIQITDSVGGYFNLLRNGPDTVISADNMIGLIPASGGARAYYYLWIDGGFVSAAGIVRGDFVDSL